MSDHSWTDQQIRFLNNLVSGEFGSQTEAYQDAYPNSRSASSSATILMKKPWFKEELEIRRAEQLYKADVTKERILTEEKAIAFLDPAELFKPNDSLFGRRNKYKLMEIPEMPPEVRRSIASYKEKQTLMGDIIREVKFNDKGKSLERLAKYIGMLKDESQIFNLEIFQVVMELLGDDKSREFRAIVRGMLVERGAIKDR